jgi:glycosyltransferase involved in cell wall biosynthesis
LGNGGIAHYTYNLINALVKLGIEVSLFTSKRYEFENENKPFKVYNNMFYLSAYLIKRIPSIDKQSKGFSLLRRLLKAIEYPFNVVQLAFILISKKTKVAHIQSVNLIELLMIIALRIINRRVVFTIHNVMPRHQRIRFYHKLLYRAMYSFCHEIIIHSIKGKEEVAELYRINGNKIHVIPHGDYKFFMPKDQISKEEAKARLGISSDCKTILFFGAIRENKGLKNILFALPSIKEKVYKVKLLIVGETWEDYRKYRKIIVEKDLQESVYEKLGYVANDEVPIYFFAADVVVLPYNEITQSGILQIAYAFGKPVVATDLAGFREALVEGRNGFLVPLGDLNELSNKVIDILLNEDMAAKMGAFSLHLSNTRFGWDEIAQKTIAVYNLNR